MKITDSVIRSETKNLMLSMKYETLHSVQGDNFETFVRASIKNIQGFVNFIYRLTVKYFITLFTKCQYFFGQNVYLFNLHSCYNIRKIEKIEIELRNAVKLTK